MTPEFYSKTLMFAKKGETTPKNPKQDRERIKRIERRVPRDGKNKKK